MPSQPKAKTENFYTGLRQTLFLQYELCRFSVPILVTAKIDARHLLKNREGSVSAHFISAFSRALKKHPALNASFARERTLFGGRTRIVRFDRVSAAVAVDKTIHGERFPFAYVIADSDQKSVAEINDILRSLVATPAEEIPEFAGLAKFSKLPLGLRRFFMKQMVYDAEKLHNKIGSFNFTNVGKWSGLEHAFAHSPRLVIALGHSQNGIFPVSYSFNHVIADGAQIGEFHEDVVKILAAPAEEKS